MAAKDLSNLSKSVVFGNDDVIVQKLIADIPGGRTINFDGFALDSIPAGHVIISKDGDYRPHPVIIDEDGKTSYGSITSGYAVAGVLYRTITKGRPEGSIMINGVINEGAVATPFTSAIKTALKNISFLAAETINS